MNPIKSTENIYEKERIYEVEYCASYGITEEIRDIQFNVLQEAKKLFCYGYSNALACFGEKVRNDGIVELHTKVYACKDNSLSSHLNSRYRQEFSKRHGFDKARCFVLNNSTLNRFN